MFDSTVGVVIFDFILGIAGIIYLFGYIGACIGLAKTALDKGHLENAIVIFFLGLPYMVYVASLPDLKARSVNIVSVSTGAATDSTKLANRFTWKCKCGKVNRHYYEDICQRCGKAKWQQENDNAVKNDLWKYTNEAHKDSSE